MPTCIRLKEIHEHVQEHIEKHNTHTKKNNTYKYLDKHKYIHTQDQISTENLTHTSIIRAMDIEWTVSRFHEKCAGSCSHLEVFRHRESSSVALSYLPPPM